VSRARQERDLPSERAQQQTLLALRELARDALELALEIAASIDALLDLGSEIFLDGNESGIDGFRGEPRRIGGRAASAGRRWR